MNKKISSLIVFIGLVATWVFAGETDVKTGAVQGVVFTSDADGGRSVVPGAKVFLDGPAVRETETDDAAGCAPKFPQIIAGDFNLDVSNPRPAAPLSGAGFRDAVQAARTPTTPPRRLLEAGRQIDWAFVRGPIQANRGQVHQSVRASDHYPISFDLHPPK
jgi:hypothetical protein